MRVMRHRHRLAFWGALLPLLAVWLIAGNPFAWGGDPLAEIQGRIQERTLSNGLKVILLENHDAPVVSFATMANVGSVDEEVGITGLAHIFEHMAFKGTSTLGTKDIKAEREAMAAEDQAFQTLLDERLKGDLADPERLMELQQQLDAAKDRAREYVVSNAMDEILSREGVQGLNAGTSFDQTTYYYSLPSNRFELWCLLESNRFIDPVLREFYTEKQVVAEERRMAVESNPTGRLVEEFLAAAYKAHPYGVHVIGSMSDIQNVTRQEALSFFRQHYNAANLVVAVAGDVYPDEAWPLLEKYFGRIPRGTRTPPVGTVEPPQNSERRVTTYEEAQPILLLGFHKPSFNHPDRAVYDAISDVLGNGRSSRLYKSLVKETKMAIAAFAFTGLPGDKYPGLFIFIGVPAKGHTNAELEQAIWKEIEKLQAEPVSEQELKKLKTRAKADFLRGLDSNSGMSYQLAYYQTLAGDWRRMFTEVEKIEKVTAEDITRVAREVFTRDNLVVGAIEPKEEKEGGEAAQQP